MKRAALIALLLGSTLLQGCGVYLAALRKSQSPEWQQEERQFEIERLINEAEGHYGHFKKGN